MPLVVHIDVAEPPAAALVRELETACESALPAQSRCLASASETGLRATVVWLDASHTRALVRARTADDRVRERTLVFGASDPDEQRWRSVGFAVGTLLDDEPTGTPEPPPIVPPPRAESSAAPAPPPPAPTTTPARPISASASVVGMRGVGGSFATGAELRGSADVGPTAWTLAVGGTLEQAAGRLETRLLWISLGPHLPLVSRPTARASARVELMAEEVYAERHLADTVETRSRLVPGMRAGVQLEVPLGARVHLVAATSAGLRAGRTRFVVGTAEESSLDLLRLETALGVGGRF